MTTANRLTAVSVAAGLVSSVSIALLVGGHATAGAVVGLVAQVPWVYVNLRAGAPGLWISWTAITLAYLNGLRS
jgi:hypothetical protein